MLPLDKKLFRLGVRIFGIILGGFVGLILSWIIAFGVYGVPYTTTGAEGVITRDPYGSLPKYRRNVGIHNRAKHANPTITASEFRFMLQAPVYVLDHIKTL